MKKDILYVLLQFILFALYFIDWNVFNYGFPDWLRYIALILMVIGLIVILLGVLHLNENLTVFPNPKRNANLVAKGIYGYVRHPIYLGIIIAMTSYSIYSVAPLKFMITGVMILVLYFKTNFEEKKLVETYAGYEKYRKTTGRFFPKRF